MTASTVVPVAVSDPEAPVTVPAYTQMPPNGAPEEALVTVPVTIPVAGAEAA